ncbi:protein RRNAD1 [Biomphalaria glabrata]|nr:protein RRNAD1 [Biomphalaria glabrata]
MATFTLCNSKTITSIRKRAHCLSLLLDNYRWIIDSYVSDFYTSTHWGKLPKSVQEYFDNVDPAHFAWLLEKNEVANTNRLIPPLILLTLHCCIHNFSLNRIGVDIESPQTQQDIASALLETNDGDIVDTRCIQQCNYKNGQCMDMEYMFRKHVKPKKQHEINKLGQTVKLLSKTCSASQVIDVGAGLGHLSRILTFQHGLKVTTVEAADGHAPKACSYDKEAKKDVCKANVKKICQVMPKSLESSMKSLENQGKKENKIEQNHCHDSCIRKCNSSSTNYYGISKNGEQYVSCDDKFDLVITDDKNVLKSDLYNKFTEDNDLDYLPSHVICKVNPDIDASNFLDIVNIRNNNGQNQFILVGLHACGDLTPTLLRVFVDCPEAIALASVACCYMKISTDGSTRLANFPMSKFSKTLPFCSLTYVSRELACHFIDAYYQRLKANDQHLKIHSYRAALQCILKFACPQFKNGDYRLVSKKGSRGTFTEYAVEILKKVGIDADSVPQEMYQHCEMLTQYWKRVVAFYTIRLSLAPVVETFILLDRALFLNEKGVSSVLVPIFNSSISPRNFALLAIKQ